MEFTSERKRVLLIGGCGFVGSHVADEFLSHEFEVTVLCHGPEKFRTPLPFVNYIYANCNDEEALNRVLSAGIDVVVHLASSTVPSTSNTDTSFDVSSNLMVALKLLDACVKHKVKKFILASSGGTVYGVPKQLPIREEDPTNPICSYGIVKLAVEKYLQLYQRLHGLEYAVLRISNPYGPRQDPRNVQGVVAVFAAKLLEHKPITIWGTGNAVRDFIHVQDLARLFYLAAISGTSGVFNASSGIGVSVNELLAMMMAQFSTRSQVSRVSSRTCDVPASVLSNARARSAFGWEPKISLTQGLIQVGEWLLRDVIAPGLSANELPAAVDRLLLDLPPTVSTTVRELVLLDRPAAIHHNLPR